MKKTIIPAMFVLLLLSACAQQDPADISVRLPIPSIEAGFTGFYSAIDQGYYADEGLNVSFHMGSPETNPVRMVASGADEFGVLGGPDTLLVAQSKGLPLVALGVLHKDSDFPVIVTLKDSGLMRLEDLEGKKIGFFYGHISTDVLRNLLRKHNINYTEVDVGFDYSQLITEKIDAQWAWRTTAGINLPVRGYEINVISPKEYGITTHGFTIFTTKEMVESHPDVIERFMRATLRGVDYSLQFPDEALESILVRDSSLDPDLERRRLAEFNSRITRPLGHMDLEMFEETHERLLESGVIENELDVRDSYTARFIPESG